jgi:Flp pilus assembly secretin CpaC
MALLFAMAPVRAQQASAPPAQTTESAPAAAADANTAKQPGNSDRKRALKLYLAASKAFEKENFQEAMREYQQAAALDPSNANYALAAELARSHAVTALVQTAAKDRLRSDAAGARAALAQALELDPKNPLVTEHLRELGDDALLRQPGSLYEGKVRRIGEAVILAPTSGAHSFHLHSDQRQALQQVFKAYGLDTTLDESVRPTQIRLDMDDASFEQASRTIGLLTNTFYVALDAHRVVVAKNTTENRQQFMRQSLETIYLPGLTATELTDVGNLAKNVFDAQQAVVQPSTNTLTIRASERTLEAFDATLSELLDGRSQVLLDLRLIQIAHNSTRNTGVQQPQALGLYNVDAEVQSIVSQNQALIQQIVSSGLAAPGDIGAILGILIASGQVSSALFSGGFAEFGGNCPLTTNSTCSPTAFALAPGTSTLNLNLNSSDSRELDQMELRLGDGEAATLRTGTRYPIQTSSFSGLSASLPNIPGLTGAGASGALSSLLAQYASSVPNVPQVEYQDLGLTLKATPSVMRNGNVALNLDLKITALAGSSINGNPILNNRSYSGVVTVKEGQAIVVMSELDKSESRAVSGTPGISEVPGLNNVTDKDAQKNYATLLLVITPHVIRGPQAAGHSPMLRIDRSTPAH